MNNNCSNSIPRPEYPRPQLVRKQWINLNGTWKFEFDFGKSGRSRKMYETDSFSKEIIVPFCPESKLSGIEYKDFIPTVWYQREFDISEAWLANRTIIHFGAVDYDAEVWVNGISAGKHRGGYSSFSFDISHLVKAGNNIVTVCAEDDVRSTLQPAGKQSDEYHSYSCSYTRTTGIWQTVWLECVPQEYIKTVKYIPDPNNSCIHIEAIFNQSLENHTFGATAIFNGIEVGGSQVTVRTNTANLVIQLSETHLWAPGEPNLYDLKLTLSNDDTTIDAVESYFGLRTITLREGAILINGKPVFQRLVLDQGFYPDGIYTAPNDEALKNDIEISIGLGFNGARLHEKIFEPRFLYWADRLGYLVWGEHANWVLDISVPVALERFLPEWLEAVERDFNHPAIVGWCPFNETQYNQDNEVVRITYLVTKALDKTRPVIDSSGWMHVITDIFDVHDYEQDPQKFSAKFKGLETGENVFVNFPEKTRYEGQPYFVSEYGGIWWNPGDENGWGYGSRPGSPEEFVERYKNLTEALLFNPKICALCYTQLYDVEQEVNGLYTYDRTPKFDPEIFRKINTQKAAIE